MNNSANIVKTANFVQILCLRRFMKGKIAILFLAVMSMLTLSCSRSGYVKIEGYAQGGTYYVTFSMDGVSQPAVEIRDSIEGILRRIDFTLSGYNKNSVLSHFNAGEDIVIDEMFADIYSHAYDICKETGGAVDVSFSPLYDMWGFGFKSGSMPSANQVDSVMVFCGMHKLRETMSDLVGSVVSPSVLSDGTFNPHMGCAEHQPQISHRQRSLRLGLRRGYDSSQRQCYRCYLHYVIGYPFRLYGYSGWRPRQNTYRSLLSVGLR